MSSSVLNFKMQDASGTCEIHGDYETQVIMRGDKPAHEVACPVCTADHMVSERKQQDDETKAKRIENAAKYRINRIGFPERLRGKLLEDYKPATDLAKRHLSECRAYVENFKVHWGSGSNLIMCGKPGTGKTHLACAIAQQIAQSSNTTITYTTTTKMLREIRATYNRNSELSEADVIGSYTSEDLLIIDEIGVKIPSENDRALLFEIIDERYQNVLPTIVISNLLVSEIAEQTDARLVDRLKENGTLMTFDWASYR